MIYYEQIAKNFVKLKNPYKIEIFIIFEVNR